jgi:hypothetical protein
MFRNELMVAPQITELGQRFATSEQMRGYTEAFVRQQGSRAKYGELYQWAVMMPHVQGVLAYLVLIGYPFAAMLMVIPGYWKAFFTWISFFAWVKLWDVGFAIVHALERSVWAMIGNSSSMARVGRRLINTAKLGNGDIEVSCGGGGAGGGAAGGTGGLNSQQLAELCSVPEVKEAGALSEDNAWFLLDQSLAVAGSLDLDLSNGYYIYIMAALYFAVPAVTGQLVLGAKASLGGLATQAIGQSATEAGGAAKSGTVGENANRLQTNQASIDQAAKMKSYRQSGFAQQSLDQQNAAMNADIRGAEIGGMSRGVEAFGSARQLTADLGRNNKDVASAGAAVLAHPAGKMKKLKTLGALAGGNLLRNAVEPYFAEGAGGGGGSEGEGSDGSGEAEGSDDRGSDGSAGLGASGSGGGRAGRGGGGRGAGRGRAGGGGRNKPRRLAAANMAGGGASSGTAGGGTGFYQDIDNPGSATSTTGNLPRDNNTNSGGNGNTGDRGTPPPPPQSKPQPFWQSLAELALQSEVNSYMQRAGHQRAFGGALGLNLGWDKSAQDLYKGGHQAYGQRMGGSADFEAASAAWDAKAQFSNLSGLFGVYGGNPGSLGPGQKPGDMMSFAMSGGLGSDARNAARYPGSSYFWTAGEAMTRGKKGYGSAAYMQNFAPTSVLGFSSNAAHHGLDKLADIGVQVTNGAARGFGQEGPLLENTGKDYTDQAREATKGALEGKFGPPR